MQRFFARLVFAFSIAGAAVCLLLHAGTFFTVIPPIWLLIPAALIFGAMLCTQIVGLPQRFDAPALNWKSLVSLILLIYAVLTFVYFYRTTGGASSVGVVEGQYVAMYKNRVIKVISEQ